MTPDFLIIYLIGDDILEVVSKTFVQPGVCPPLGTDQVTEPLMRKLVAHDSGDTFLRCGCSNIFFDKKCALSAIRR